MAFLRNIPSKKRGVTQCLWCTPNYFINSYNGLGISPMNVTLSNWGSINTLLDTLSIKFPCGSAGKESTCNAGDLGLIPGLGRPPEEGKGYPLQYPSLENSMDCLVHGVAKSQIRLNNFHLTLYRYWKTMYMLVGSMTLKETQIIQALNFWFCHSHFSIDKGKNNWGRVVGAHLFSWYFILNPLYLYLLSAAVIIGNREYCLKFSR